MIAGGGSARISFTPKPSGAALVSHPRPANRDLKCGLYSGQSGMIYVDPQNDPGSYDQEHFLALHDWEPYYAASDDGSLMVKYAAGSVNGRQLGHGTP